MGKLSGDQLSRLGVSPITGDVYLVTEYDERGAGKLVAKEKRTLGRDEYDVPVVHSLARKLRSDGQLGGSR
jgi:predicted nucleotidyltransferase component of viral defense system